MATNDLLPTALVSTGTAPAAIPQLAPHQAAPQKDRFARQAGPDASFKGPNGLTEAYAVFQIDPESKQLLVTVVDAEGQVLRVIPPRSVSQMMESMGRYRP
jgi:FlaG protein